LEGFHLGSRCAFNNIFGNNITDSLLGIYCAMNFGNSIYHNNFINNTQQVYIPVPSVTINIWDGGYPSGGNYWSDYTGVDDKSGPNQQLPGSDGIGDTSYTIDANNIDHYPLLNPWTPTPATATIDIHPYSLNLWSRGGEIVAYIELPEDYSVNGILISTIMLNKTIPVDLATSTEVGDHDNDGVLDLMVKFNRSEVISYIFGNVNTTRLFEKRFMTVTLTMIGRLNDGKIFQGNDTIRIILPKNAFLRL